MFTWRLGVNLACVIPLTLAAALLAFSTSSCGTSKQGPPTPIVIHLVAGACLAPGEDAQLPVTVRILLEVLGQDLPLNAVSFDPDGDGEISPVTPNFFPLTQDRIGTDLFYFDYEWSGPNETMAEVTIFCATGTYTRSVWLQLDQLPPWPY